MPTIYFLLSLVAQKYLARIKLFQTKSRETESRNKYLHQTNFDMSMNFVEVRVQERK